MNWNADPTEGMSISSLDEEVLMNINYLDHVHYGDQLIPTARDIVAQLQVLRGLFLVNPTQTREIELGTFEVNAKFNVDFMHPAQRAFCQSITEELDVLSKARLDNQYKAWASNPEINKPVKKVVFIGLEGTEIAKCDDGAKVERQSAATQHGGSDTNKKELVNSTVCSSTGWDTVPAANWDTAPAADWYNWPCTGWEDELQQPENPNESHKVTSDMIHNAELRCNEEVGCQERALMTRGINFIQSLRKQGRCEAYIDSVNGMMDRIDEQRRLAIQA